MSYQRNRGRGPSGLGVAIAVGVIAIVALGVVLSSRGSNNSTSDVNASGAITQAPAVALPATTGETVDLAAFRGKRNVLLYFYEHAG